MDLFISKKIFVPLAVISIVCLGYVVLSGIYPGGHANQDASVTDGSKEYEGEHQGEVVTNAFVSARKDVDLAATKKSPSAQEVRTLAGTPSEAEVVRKWEESRGRFDEESLKDYAGYDLDTLRSLVKNGDVKAMIALARSYVSEQYASEYGVKYSMPLLKMAAAHGSSYAMELYAIQYEAEHFVNGTNDRNALLEVLSWNNAAALRGDVYPNNSTTLNLRRKNIYVTD